MLYGTHFLETDGDGVIGRMHRTLDAFPGDLSSSFSLLFAIVCLGECNASEANARAETSSLR